MQCYRIVYIYDISINNLVYVKFTVFKVPICFSYFQFYSSGSIYCYDERSGDALLYMQHHSTNTLRGTNRHFEGRPHSCGVTQVEIY